jgi:hypothetical protein
MRIDRPSVDYEGSLRWRVSSFVIGRQCCVEINLKIPHQRF